MKNLAPVIKSNPDTFFQALDLTFILWGRYGYENLDKAVKEAANTYKINDKIIYREINTMEEYLKKQNSEVKA